MQTLGLAKLSISSLYLTFATALLLFLAGFQHITGRDALHSSLCFHLDSSSWVILISVCALMAPVINALLQQVVVDANLLDMDCHYTTG